MSDPLTYRPFASLGIDETRFEPGTRLWSRFTGRRHECQMETGACEASPHNPCWAWTNVEPTRNTDGAKLVVTGVNHQTGVVTVSSLDEGEDVSACMCHPEERTGGQHAFDCPAYEMECTCYEIFGVAHQPGCPMHKR